MALTLGTFDSKDFAGTLRKIATYLGTVSAAEARWQAVVRADDNGEPITPRATAGSMTSASASGTAAVALAASSTRLGFRLQNLSEDTVIWWAYGATVTATEAFKLFPGAAVVEGGETHCRDAVRVVTESGTANYAVQAW